MLFLFIISLAAAFLEQFIPSSAALNVLIFLTLILLIAFMFAWIYTALIKALGNLVTAGTMPPWKESMATSLPLLWPLFYTFILLGLIVMAGYFLLIIPGIIFSIWYAFTIYQVIFENTYGMAALRASKQLVAGRWWTILFSLLIPQMVFNVAVVFAVSIAGLPLLFVSNPEAAIFARTIISTVVSMLCTPLLILPGIILYFSARQNPAAQSPTTPTAPTTPAHL